MKKTCQLYCYNPEYVDIYNETLDTFIKDRSVLNLSDDRVHWYNFHDISQKEKIEKYFKSQHYNQLTIEDIYSVVKRPKLEEYEKYLFFSIRSALPTSTESRKLQQEQISFILGKNYLMSLQEKKSDHFTEVRERITNKKGVIRDKGTDFLLYRLLDAIVDNYFEVLDDMTKVVERLDRQITTSRNPELPQKIEIQKRKLMELRKIVLPLKDIAILLVAAKHEYLSDENHHYFVDLKENCISVLDEIDTNKSLLEGMSSLYYAIQGQRMNEIMKVLTVVSAIFIPLTFIAGIYGMNFDNMPELHYKNGYYVVLGGMLIVAVGLVLYFVKRGWLNRK